MKSVNSKVNTAKIILAMRIDLYESVLSAAIGGGFQSEKFHESCIRLTWTKGQLTQLLDKRVDRLFRHKYAKTTATTIGDVLEPTKRSATDHLTFILDRTLMRPRDAIAFLNACIQFVDASFIISRDAIAKAERVYSDGRLVSLTQEWETRYQCLRSIIEVLKRAKSLFVLAEIGRDQLDQLCLSVWEFIESPTLPIREDVLALRHYAHKSLSATELRAKLAFILYQVGAVGIMTAPGRAVSWSQDEFDRVDMNDIKDAAVLHVHPMLYRALGVQDVVP